MYRLPKRESFIYLFIYFKIYLYRVSLSDKCCFFRNGPVLGKNIVEIYIKSTITYQSTCNLVVETKKQTLHTKHTKPIIILYRQYSYHYSNMSKQYIICNANTNRIMLIGYAQNAKIIHSIVTVYGIIIHVYIQFAYDNAYHRLIIACA